MSNVDAKADSNVGGNRFSGFADSQWTLPSSGINSGDPPPIASRSASLQVPSYVWQLT